MLLQLTSDTECTHKDSIAVMIKNCMIAGLWDLMVTWYKITAHMYTMDNCQKSSIHALNIRGRSRTGLIAMAEIEGPRYAQKNHGAY